MELGDIQAAAKMRDLIEKIATGVVDTLRPEPRVGMVHHYDPRAQSAWIYFKGDTTDNLVKARIADNMAPTRSIETDGEGLANIVRVNGRPGNYYVLDYVRGGPRAFMSQPSLHVNNDFEIGTIGVLPSSWSDFWNNGGVTARCDDSVVRNGRMSCKVVIPAGSGNNVALQSTTLIHVTPGELLEISCSAISNNPQARIQVEVLFAPAGGNPDYFASGAVSYQLDSYLPSVNRFSDMVTSITVPVGFGEARIVYRCTTLDSSVGTMWIDDTFSRSLGNSYIQSTGPSLQINTSGGMKTYRDVHQNDLWNNTFVNGWIVVVTKIPVSVGAMIRFNVTARSSYGNDFYNGTGNVYCYASGGSGTIFGTGWLSNGGDYLGCFFARDGSNNLVLIFTNSRNGISTGSWNYGTTIKISDMEVSLGASGFRDDLAMGWTSTIQSSISTYLASVVTPETNDTGWIAPTLLNSWQNYGSPYSPAGYRRVDNRVQLRGLVRLGTLGTTIFNLPTDCCPIYIGLFPAVVSSIPSGNPNTGVVHFHFPNNGATRIDVNTSGAVVQAEGTNASNGFISLDGISFYTDS